MNAQPQHQASRELKKALVTDYIRMLPVKKYACAYAGVSRETLDRWLRSDKEFETRFMEAQASFFGKTASRARPEFLLERLDRETFGREDIVSRVESPPIALVSFIGEDNTDHD